MCVMCGFIAEPGIQAAERLMAAGSRIEGLWSGVYTGLGVLGSDGVLRHHKVIGWSKYWKEKYSTSSLEGSVGLFHSRTGPCGDERYAHPFFSKDGAVHLISQGNTGFFGAYAARASEIGTMLAESGVRFDSADKDMTRHKYPLLKDGSQVHISEIVTEYAAWLYRQTGDPLESVRRAASEIREAAVSLFVFRDRPGRIYAANMSQRMALCRKEDGLWMSTCRLAFGDEFRRVLELPPCSAAEISLDSLRIIPLAEDLRIDNVVPAGTEEAFLRYVGEHPHTLLAYIANEAVGPLFPQDHTVQTVPVTYGIFEKLYYDGKLRLETEEQDGFAGTTSLRTFISLK